MSVHKAKQNHIAHILEMNTYEEFSMKQDVMNDPLHNFCS